MHAPLTSNPSIATPATVKHDLTNTIQTVRGRWLAHNHDSATKRALIARELYLGEVYLASPTLRQSAMLARCSEPYARLALAATPEQRTLLWRGQMKLTDVGTPNFEEEWCRHPEAREAFVRGRLAEIWNLVERCTAA
jgi:hypothetical protein